MKSLTEKQRTSPTKRLTGKETAFVRAFLGAAAGNGAKAAALAGYGKASAKVTASRLMKKPKIQAALVSHKDALANHALTAADIVRDRVMTHDEALTQMTVYARADIGLVLGPDDPISKLPLEVRKTIKSVRPSRYGRTIELYDAMHATEQIVKQFKDTVEIDNLEALIARSMRPVVGATA